MTHASMRERLGEIDADIPAVDGSRHGIAVVGCGSIAGTHLTAYSRAGYEVRALCDVERENAERLRREYYPDAAVYTDHQRALRREDVTVVDVATAPGPRAAIVEDALRAGKHVLSQKPFVLDVATGERLVSLAESEGVLLAVNQNARWAPAFRHLLAACREGALGRVHGAYVQQIWDYNRIADEDVSHRLLAYYAIHWLDLVRTMFPGTEPSQVIARTTNTPTQEPTEPVTAGLLLEYDDAQAVLAFDGDAASGHASSTRVVGSDATATVEGPDLNSHRFVVHHPDGSISPELEGSWFPTGFHGAMAALLAAVERGDRPPHSGRDNLRTLELVFAAVESARTGDPVVPGSVRSLPD